MAEPERLRALSRCRSIARRPPAARANKEPISWCAGGAAPPIVDHARQPRARCPGPGIRRATRSARSTQLINRHTDHADVRQHPRAGRDAVFQELWRINDDNLPIALHHGSLDVAQRAQGRGRDGARAACAPSSAPRSLDLGIDWGDVDLVINVGAPKGACAPGASASAAPTTGSTSPRAALLVPANRFEVLECRAAHRGGARRMPRTPQPLRPARSTCWRSTCSAAPAPRRSPPISFMHEVIGGRVLSPSCRAQRFRRRDRVRRDRRLRAESLRALRQASSRRRMASGASRNPRVAPAVPA
ncbi:MAG: hypothetical protein MZV49_16700 [Rhodopseudomonas palustris]|nr:hypothetical protein [Rhodopseudomonas palustris]